MNLALHSACFLPQCDGRCRAIGVYLPLGDYPPKSLRLMMSTHRRLDAIPKQIHHEGMTVRSAPYNHASSNWFALDEDVYPRPGNGLAEGVARPNRIDGAFGGP